MSFILETPPEEIDISQIQTGANLDIYANKTEKQFVINVIDGKIIGLTDKQKRIIREKINIYKNLYQKYRRLARMSSRNKNLRYAAIYQKYASLLEERLKEINRISKIAKFNLDVLKNRRLTQLLNAYIKYKKLINGKWRRQIWNPYTRTLTLSRTVTKSKDYALYKKIENFLDTVVISKIGKRRKKDISNEISTFIFFSH